MVSPGRYSLSRGLLPGRSVPCFRSTVNCAGVSRVRQSASVIATSNGFVGAVDLVPRAHEPGQGPHRTDPQYRLKQSSFRHSEPSFPGDTHLHMVEGYALRRGLGVTKMSTGDRTTVKQCATA